MKESKTVPQRPPDRGGHRRRGYIHIVPVLGAGARVANAGYPHTLFEVEKTCPVVDKTEEENGKGLKLRSVGDPRTPALALCQSCLPVTVAKGRAMRGSIVGVSSPTA